MYAINHASTTLLLKRRYPQLPILPLLVSTQLMELLWVLFNFLGLERYFIVGGELHLGYLPYSHSVLSALSLAFISYSIIRWVLKKKSLALPFAIGVLSHLILDFVFHERDIRLSPFTQEPAWGLGIIKYPLINFVIEFCYGLLCWSQFRGNRKLLVAIVLFNVLNFPIMLASGSALKPLTQYPVLLPCFILFQITITWYFIARYSRSEVILRSKILTSTAIKNDP